MARKISQRAARAALKELAALRDRDNMRTASWSKDWPGGTHIDTIEVQNVEYMIALTARKCGHAVVVVPGDINKLKVFAVVP